MIGSCRAAIVRNTLLQRSDSDIKDRVDDRVLRGERHRRAINKTKKRSHPM